MHMTGFPGVGKTEFTKSLEAGFDRVGIKCKVVVLIGSIREPQDFGGFPVSTPDGVRLMPMAWARALHSCSTTRFSPLGPADRRRLWITMTFMPVSFARLAASVANYR